MLPAATEPGAAVFVTDRSACAPVATTSLAVALLFEEFGSVVAELTLTVSLMVVPEAVPALTFTTNVIVAGVPGAKLGFEQVSVPTLQIHPAGPESVCAVVFAGRVSVTVTFVAVLGPALLITCE